MYSFVFSRSVNISAFHLPRIKHLISILFQILSSNSSLHPEQQQWQWQVPGAHPLQLQLLSSYIRGAPVPWHTVTPGPWSPPDTGQWSHSQPWSPHWACVWTGHSGLPPHSQNLLSDTTLWYLLSYLCKFYYASQSILQKSILNESRASGVIVKLTFQLWHNCICQPARSTASIVDVLAPPPFPFITKCNVRCIKKIA